MGAGGQGRESLAVDFVTAQAHRLRHRVIVIPDIRALDPYGLKPVLIQKLSAESPRGPTSREIALVVLL
jgi:hypothetical protein